MNGSQRNLPYIDETVPKGNMTLDGYASRHVSSSYDCGSQPEGPRRKFKRKWLATSGCAYQIKPSSKQIFPSFHHSTMRPAVMGGLDRTTDNDAETTEHL
jgi:hypothetical protein